MDKVRKLASIPLARPREGFHKHKGSGLPITVYLLAQIAATLEGILKELKQTRYTTNPR